MNNNKKKLEAISICKNLILEQGVKDSSKCILTDVIETLDFYDIDNFNFLNSIPGNSEREGLALTFLKKNKTITPFLLDFIEKMVNMGEEIGSNFISFFVRSFSATHKSRDHCRDELKRFKDLFIKNYSAKIFLQEDNEGKRILVDSIMELFYELDLRALVLAGEISSDESTLIDKKMENEYPVYKKDLISIFEKSPAIKPYLLRRQIASYPVQFLGCIDGYNEMLANGKLFAPVFFHILQVFDNDTVDLSLNILDQNNIDYSIVNGSGKTFYEELENRIFYFTLNKAPSFKIESLKKIKEFYEKKILNVESNSEFNL